MKILPSVLLFLAAAPAAQAQSFSASGQVGYLQEWELKASMAKTLTRNGEDYAGPVTLRHVGLCSANGVEEKYGTIRLAVSRSGIEGTLAMKDDNCKIVASAARSHSGLLRCRDGQGIPINFSIEQTSINQTSIDQTATADRGGPAVR